MGCDVLVRPRVPQAWLKGAFDFEKIVDGGVSITYDAITEIEQTEGDLDKSMMRRQARTSLVAAVISEQELDERF